VSGRTVLFAGAGLSGHALPSWKELIERMRTWALEEGALSPDVKTAVERALNDGELISAAQSLSERLGPESFHRFLLAVFRDPSAAPGPAHALLAQLNWSSVLTTNYDRLIETVLPESKWRRYSYNRPAELALVLTEQVPAVVKLHGDIDEQSTIVLGETDYRKLLESPDLEPFRHFLETIFATRTVLFLGYSLQDADILMFLSRAMDRMGGYAGPHFALMKTMGMKDSSRQKYRHNYGVLVLGDDERQDYPDIAGFLENLLRRSRRAVIVSRRVKWVFPALLVSGIWAGTETSQALWYAGIGAVSVGFTGWLARRTPATELFSLTVSAATTNIAPFLIRAFLEYEVNLGRFLHVPPAGHLGSLVLTLTFACLNVGVCKFLRRR
jgi:hypothetical protein